MPTSDYRKVFRQLFPPVTTLPTVFKSFPTYGMTAPDLQEVMPSKTTINI